MFKIPQIFSLLSGAILLLTINRKTNLTQGLLQPYEYLRWQDFHAMITLPFIITLIYTLLFIAVTSRQPRLHKHFGSYIIIFVTGILLYGISSGNHEVTNYLHHRFCVGETSSICQIIQYNDDSFSHLIFYLSSIIMTLALLFFEIAQPESKPISNKSLAIIIINAGLIGTGLFLNLALENLGIDLYSFGILSAISLSLLYLKSEEFRSYPIITYCA